MNELYPIFIKPHQLDILIVGGGFVGLEKLTFLLKSSPRAKGTLVSIDFIPEVLNIIEEKQFVSHRKAYSVEDLAERDVVIGATNDEAVNEKIYYDCKARNILVNIADNPPLCDFYMGGIVTKGNLKVAISTNGKSHTMAKRLRQFFEAVLPNSIDELLENVHEYRKYLTGDFESKVEELNELTKNMIKEKQ